MKTFLGVNLPYVSTDAFEDAVLRKLQRFPNFKHSALPVPPIDIDPSLIDLSFYVKCAFSSSSGTASVIAEELLKSLGEIPDNIVSFEFYPLESLNCVDLFDQIAVNFNDFQTTSIELKFVKLIGPILLRMSPKDLISSSMTALVKKFNNLGIGRWFLDVLSLRIILALILQQINSDSFVSPLLFKSTELFTNLDDVSFTVLYNVAMEYTGNLETIFKYAFSNSIENQGEKLRARSGCLHLILAIALRAPLALTKSIWQKLLLNACPDQTECTSFPNYFYVLKHPQFCTDSMVVETIIALMVSYHYFITADPRNHFRIDLLLKFAQISPAYAEAFISSFENALITPTIDFRKQIRRFCNSTDSSFKALIVELSRYTSSHSKFKQFLREFQIHLGDPLPKRFTRVLTQIGPGDVNFDGSLSEIHDALEKVASSGWVELRNALQDSFMNEFTGFVVKFLKKKQMKALNPLKVLLFGEICAMTLELLVRLDTSAIMTLPSLILVVVDTILSVGHPLICTFDPVNSLSASLHAVRCRIAQAFSMLPKSLFISTTQQVTNVTPSLIPAYQVILLDALRMNAGSIKNIYPFFIKQLNALLNTSDLIYFELLIALTDELCQHTLSCQPLIDWLVFDFTRVITKKDLVLAHRKILYLCHILKNPMAKHQLLVCDKLDQFMEVVYNILSQQKDNVLIIETTIHIITHLVSPSISICMGSSLEFRFAYDSLPERQIPKTVSNLKQFLVVENLNNGILGDALLEFIKEVVKSPFWIKQLVAGGVCLKIVRMVTAGVNEKWIAETVADAITANAQDAEPLFEIREAIKRKKFKRSHQVAIKDLMEAHKDDVIGYDLGVLQKRVASVQPKTAKIKLEDPFTSVLRVYPSTLRRESFNQLIVVPKAPKL